MSDIKVFVNGKQYPHSIDESGKIWIVINLSKPSLFQRLFPALYKMWIKKMCKTENTPNAIYIGGEFTLLSGVSGKSVLEYIEKD